MTHRPFRAVVYLPGHGEGGVLVKCGTISYATQEGLQAACAEWVAQGYETKAYEVLALPLEAS